MVPIVWPPKTEEEFLSLPIEELAFGFLRSMVSISNSRWSRNWIGSEQTAVSHGYTFTNTRLRRRFLEIFDWLVFQGYVAAEADASSGWYYITEKGLSAGRENDGLATHKASQLLSNRLHPLIAQRARSFFALGEFESAVLMSFREVEIRVRNLGGFDETEIGVPLMRKAFRPHGGKLTNQKLDAGEQEAIANLFAGAIGAFKNPSSHRQVDYSDVTTAAESILFADLLLRILDGYDPAT